jgi:hypothetical protein
MKHGRMQAKDIDGRRVLQWLSQQDRAATHWKPLIMPSVLDAMPAGTPEKVALAKMSALLKQGLVDGCGCGCRGDWRITDKGRGLLILRGGKL